MCITNESTGVSYYSAKSETVGESFRCKDQEQSRR